MQVSGFTFVRNAMKYDYPIIESINSILPLVDEYIVIAGNSEDETEQLILSINSPKIKLIKSVWDDSLREGGRVLAEETNKAISHISKNSDWGFYLQADEVVHERFHPEIVEAMERSKDDRTVDGLLFNYTHFYGSYDFIADSRKWYRKEIRINRPHHGIKSWKDAQGFRKNGEKLNVKNSGASIYHYGWVKPPEFQQAKQTYFHSLWHSDNWMKMNIPNVSAFDYSKIDSVSLFHGTHPLSMLNRVANQNWKVEIDPRQKKLSFRFRVLLLIERITGWRVGEYRNYRLK
jgi:hypothetical protein